MSRWIGRSGWLLALMLLVGVGCGTTKSSGSGGAASEGASGSSAVEAMEAGMRGRAGEGEGLASEVDVEALREQAARVGEEDLAAFAAGVRALAAAEDRLIEEGRDLEGLKRSAQSPAEVRRAERVVLEEMQGALREVGLELEGFLVMGQLVRQNPFLLERLREHLEDEEIGRFYGVEFGD